MFQDLLRRIEETMATLADDVIRLVADVKAFTDFVGQLKQFIATGTPTVNTADLEAAIGSLEDQLAAAKAALPGTTNPPPPPPGLGGILSFAIASPGSGYVANDILTVVQAGAQDATFSVSSVDQNGSVTAVAMTAPGKGYSVASGLATTTNGNGTGFTINVLTVSA